MEESFKKVEVMEESSKRAEIAQESSSKRVGDELEQENAKKQKVDDDQEATKMSKDCYDKRLLVEPRDTAAKLQALVDGKKIVVTEASVRRDLQLDDEEGTDCLPNATIFE
ncbi:hypothetical protein Tco_1124367 [Tanacetum coccineum]|uniref:Uncharacterized protein n=1 Tax=Tanacetum coccineum TaxID=301880 RepID=A0ABQ5J8R3_9ASTR